MYGLLHAGAGRRYGLAEARFYALPRGRAPARSEGICAPQLNQFKGNIFDTEMVKAFISPNEYRRRFGK